jgi:Rrf2 family protein
MVNIPKQLEYGLMVLGEMQSGAPGQLFPVRAVCTRLGIPFDVTSKAMQRMGRAGILRSVQGKYGGYQIVRDLSQVSLKELSDVVIGPHAVADCLAPGHSCRLSGRCTIKKAVKRLDGRLNALLAELTVLELVS